MSRITLPTRALVGLLQDAVLTAAPPKLELPYLDAVLLHTARGDWEESSGEEEDGEPLFDTFTADLLVATSTDTSIMGQGHTWCLGRLHTPVLISRLDAEAIVDLFGPLVSKRLPKTVTHQTVIDCNGGIVEVSEDIDQVPDRKYLTLMSLDLDPYPRNVEDLMTVDPTIPYKVDDRIVAPSYGTGYAGPQLEVLVKVSKRRKAPIAVYRHHQRQRVVVEVGGHWRAVLVPAGLPDDGSELEPRVEVYGPVLPERKSPVKQDPLRV